MDFSFGGQVASPLTTEDRGWNIFIWGISGVGKTTLASTMPGKILWIQFDPNGTSCLPDSDDIKVIRLEAIAESFLIKMRNTDPMDLGKFFAAYPDFNTIVLDSFTTLNDKALPQAVAESKNSSIDLPGQHGYAKRNMIMHDITKKLLEVCLKNKKNLCFIAHEGSASKDEMTGRLFKTFIAGGELANLIPLRFDEVWYLEDTGKEKRIHIRSNLNRSPMKSRLFDSSNTDSFKWTFNPSTRIGDFISKWIADSKANKGKKLHPPK